MDKSRIPRKMRRLLLIFVSIALFAGCSPVKPWQKAAFAKNHMQFDPDPLEARFRRHIFDSKEGTRGGSGSLGGGCGCN